jgi:hypothetical protein
VALQRPFARWRGGAWFSQGPEARLLWETGGYDGLGTCVRRGDVFGLCGTSLSVHHVTNTTQMT